MKRCPSCDRDFEDDTLRFCPHDGAGLVGEQTSAPVELQATMMAPPPSLGSGNYPSPPDTVRLDSGSFNQPPPVSSAGVNPAPPNQSWQNQPPAANQANQSWASLAANQTPTPRKSGLANPKILIGAAGCLGLGAIVVIGAIVLLFAMSGPSSKMNPYKSDLKDLAPEKAGTFSRIDVDVLGDKDKKDFGKVKDALGLAYKGDKDASVRVFLGNYDSAKDAEAGLKTFKDANLSKDWTKIEDGSKKVGWRTVGTRYVASKDTSTSNTNERTLRDGAKIELAQAATPTKTNMMKIVCWTNGSVIIVALGEDDVPLTFETAYDAAEK